MNVCVWERVQCFGGFCGSCCFGSSVVIVMGWFGPRAWLWFLGLLVVGFRISGHGCGCGVGVGFMWQGMRWRKRENTVNQHFSLIPKYKFMSFQFRWHLTWLRYQQFSQVTLLAWIWTDGWEWLMLWLIGGIGWVNQIFGIWFHDVWCASYEGNDIDIRSRIWRVRVRGLSPPFLLALCLNGLVLRVSCPEIPFRCC